QRDPIIHFSSQLPRMVHALPNRSRQRRRKISVPLSARRVMDTRTFVSQLRASGLLDDDDLANSVRLLEGRFPRGPDLVCELLRRGLLTPFQLAQLRAGRGRALRLGRYRLLERLGDRGQVYRAIHVTMGRTVALKLLAPGTAHEAPQREPFR